MGKEKKVIRGYKGFDKDLRCIGFQYEVGKVYECEKAVLCEEGFHFCENPLDVLDYYPPYFNGKYSRYCKVEGSGEIDKRENSNKVCCTKIKIVRELTLEELIGEGIRELGDDIVKISERGFFSRVVSNSDFSSVAFNYHHNTAAVNTGHCSMVRNMGMSSVALSTGDCSIASNSGPFGLAKNAGMLSIAVSSSGQSISKTMGEFSVSVNTGNDSLAANEGSVSVAVNTGENSQASTKGFDSIAFVTGVHGKAKGDLDCWIVLTERDDQSVGSFYIKDIKAFRVDGKTIKPDTYYTLVDGKPVEVTEVKIKC